MEIPLSLLENLAKANHIVAMTGAGVSAESGIATFRDPDGLWSKFNPMELASINGFMSNPELVWEWYQYRRAIVNKSEPNPGHYALAEMERMFPKFDLITQNVDRLHQRAGSENVWELHGNIMDNKCFDCDMPFTGEVNLPDKQIPKCESCGGRIRPCVVWFGEMLPQYAFEHADSVSRICDIFFSIGTSAEVYPAAAIPVAAKHLGVFVVEINPNVTSFSHLADVHLQGPSGEILPLMLEEFEKYKKGLS